MIKIKAFGVTSGDVRIRSGKFPKGFSIPARLALGIFAPRKKIIGSEFSGIVEDIGSKVKNFAPRDIVMGIKLFGIYTEYVVLKESSSVVKMSGSLSFEEMAGIPFVATTARFFLENGGLKGGQTILINGASGAVGSNCVQIASSIGAKVIRVCSGKNYDFVKSIGASEVIDYQKINLKEISQEFDVIFDTVGNLNFREFKHLLKKGGVFLQAVPTLREMFNKKNQEDGKRFFTGTPPEKRSDLLLIKDIIEKGRLKASIDKIFEFTDLRKAHEYVETGRKRGSVVVKF